MSRIGRQTMCLGHTARDYEINEHFSDTQPSDADATAAYPARTEETSGARVARVAHPVRSSALDKRTAPSLFASRQNSWRATLGIDEACEAPDFACAAAMRQPSPCVCSRGVCRFGAANGREAQSSWCSLCGTTSTPIWRRLCVIRSLSAPFPSREACLLARGRQQSSGRGLSASPRQKPRNACGMSHIGAA